MDGLYIPETRVLKKKNIHILIEMTTMKNNLFLIFLILQCATAVFGQVTPKYLTDRIYTADPSTHVFEGKIYIYPSHDIKTDALSGANGDHYNMKDYHVFSMDSINGKVTDHGAAMKLEDISWASRQLWAPDCAYENGLYYLYFPAKDRNDIFKIGVATSKSPTGPFKPQKNPIIGSYSIDPAVFKDNNGKFYLYFGGISGGQLQRYRNNKLVDCGKEPQEGPALTPKVAMLDKNMLDFAEEPKDVVILDENGTPLQADDHQRRFFEGVWMHYYNGKYYLSYSTGNTHNLCYAIGDNPCGPFTYKGVLLTPVTGWTTHHSIIEINSKWYLFYHDTKESGVNYLRQVKYRELKYNKDGSIVEMNGKD